MYWYFGRTSSSFRLIYLYTKKIKKSAPDMSQIKLVSIELVNSLKEKVKQIMLLYL